MKQGEKDELENRFLHVCEEGVAEGHHCVELGGVSVLDGDVGDWGALTS